MWPVSLGSCAEQTTRCSLLHSTPHQQQTTLLGVALLAAAQPQRASQVQVESARLGQQGDYRRANNRLPLIAACQRMSPTTDKKKLVEWGTESGRKGCLLASSHGFGSAPIRH